MFCVFWFCLIRLYELYMYNIILESIQRKTRVCLFTSLWMRGRTNFSDPPVSIVHIPLPLVDALCFPFYITLLIIIDCYYWLLFLIVIINGHWYLCYQYCVNIWITHLIFKNILFPIPTATFMLWSLLLLKPQSILIIIMTETYYMQALYCLPLGFN